MKHLLFISALLVIMVSCKKETTQNPNSTSFLQSIKLQLKDSISTNDFQQLNFGNSVSTIVPKTGLKFLRVPFRNKAIKGDFILLKIEGNGTFSAGKIISISKDLQPAQLKTKARFNGRINIFSLKGSILTTSTITDGYVDAFHIKQSNAREEAVEIPLMPEVVIVCTIPQTGGWYYSDYYDLGGLFYGAGGGGSNGEGGYGGGGYGLAGGGYSGSGYYSNSDLYNIGGDTPYPTGGSYNIPSEDNPELVDFEPVESLAAINLDAYIKCFSSIPDAGATCSIKILTDIPVDKDPNSFFDWKNSSPGHTFLQISKTNGTQSVQQNIGFYPTTNWKTILTTAPVDGKFVDNEEHEFNASLLMSLTPEQLQGILIHMQYLERFIKYDIDDYNCTDFALEIFNYKRGGNQLTIPMYDIPGGSAPNGTASPQGLYQQLKIMKEAGGSESGNITFPGVKGFAGDSHGPCN